MAALLGVLPLELFDLVQEDLAKRDLKALSQVSRSHHAAVVSTGRLWSSITIELEPGHSPGHTAHRIKCAGFPQEHIKQSTQLRFGSNPVYSRHLCPHYYDQHNSKDDLETESEHDVPDPDLDYPRFTILSQRAKEFISLFEDGQLNSFSWHLGSCIPAEVFSSNGILQLTQRSLQSLSLISDPYCCTEGYAGAEVDLSSFRQLQSLRWVAPGINHFYALSVAIQSNCEHLQELTVDFVNWLEILDILAFFEGEDDPEDEARVFFSKNILGFSKDSSRPMFPAIRIVSFTEIPLCSLMAHAFNVGTLVSLTLRNCPDWADFLKSVSSLHLPIMLRQLEIQDAREERAGSGEEEFAEFLGAFEGLESLFWAQSGLLAGSAVLWNSIGLHHATLKKLVFHRRTRSTVCNDGVESFDDSHVSVMQRISEKWHDVGNFDAVSDPNLPAGWRLFADLELDFLGIPGEPSCLKRNLLPFVTKSSLKVLHIRQSKRDLHYFASWALAQKPSDERREIPSPITKDESAPLAHADVSDLAGVINDYVDGCKSGGELEVCLRRDFRDFVEWVFGPEGIASLQLVAFGDFTPASEALSEALLLRRSIDGSENFRFVEVCGPEGTAIREKYEMELEACPVEPYC